VSKGDLVERSRAAFVARFPDVITELDKVAPLGAVVFEDGHAVDIVIGEKRIYGGDARHFAAEQVDAFMKKPLRLFMEEPGAAGLISEICIRMVKAIRDGMADRGIEEIRLHPTDNPTFLIVFGLGLGHHLMELAMRSKARWLILVEPSLEFIEHSFQALDWSELLDHYDGQDGAVHIVTSNDPARMVAAIVRNVGRYGIPFVDGASVFTHYPYWAFAEARTRLHDAIQFAFVNRGFFEDEIKMMSNATANFNAAPFWLLEGKRRLRRPETAVIVGAGPSLDESLDTIHRIRDRVVLFSGGTALRPLLRNGIVPDFHCELENVPAVVDVLERAGKYGDLSKIRLIASATVDPRVPPLFADNLFFFRDSVSSTMIIGSPDQTLHGTAPTCVNTALVSAIALGFTDILLFGTDCGTRPGGQHHASDTVYRDVGLYKENADKRAAFPLEVEGNFGGVARTDWIYDACRRMLGEAIRAFGLSVVNCSDGAMIPGARPLDSEAVSVETPPVDRAKLMADLDRTLRHFEPGEILRDRDVSALIEHTREFCREVEEILDGFDPEDADFGGIFKAIKDHLFRNFDELGQVDAMMSGTLFALPRIGMFYGFRVEAGELRRHVFDIYMAEMREILKEMEQRTIELFEHLAEHPADASELPPMPAA